MGEAPLVQGTVSVAARSAPASRTVRAAKFKIKSLGAAHRVGKRLVTQGPSRSSLALSLRTEIPWHAVPCTGPQRHPTPNRGESER